MRRVRPWATCAILLLGLAPAPTVAQSRFDLRDWERKPIANSPTAFFECAAPQHCGARSAVSGRLAARPQQPVTVEAHRTREMEIARRMRERAAGRIKDIEMGETRQAEVESLPLVYTEKRVIATDDSSRTYVDGVMIGKTRAYTIVASGVDPEQVRNNFQGFVRIVALILDQMALRPPSNATPTQQ